MHLGAWRRRWRRRGADRGSILRLGLAMFGVWICYRLLAAVWTVFQHAYVNSFYLLSGSQVNQAYWGAVRFAFRGTVLVVALGTILAVMAALQLGGGRRR